LFGNQRGNVSNGDAYLRFFLALVAAFFAIKLSSFPFLLASLFLVYTGSKQFCFLYYILKINDRLGKNKHYLSLLPKYRTTPVFIFNGNGEIIFENGPAEERCAYIKSIVDIHVDDYREIIEKEERKELIHKHDGIYYQVEIIPVKKENIIFAYFNDVSKVIELNDEIEDTQREVIYAMGEIGETRSKETGNHVKRVALYSKKLALLYGLSFEKANILHMASPMHDIGKVGIPDAILNAPRKLTKEEFEVMKTHASLGYEMLKYSSKPILKAAAIVANEHHEKWDGSGYPNAKSGEDIHIYGRITAVADVFDALGSERVYKKAWELEKILALFDAESGKHFDPQLVKLFKDNLDVFLEIRNTFKDK
jgi:response regulator RpfG family c-di-GMP phosphodiesterase